MISVRSSLLLNSDDDDEMFDSSLVMFKHPSDNKDEFIEFWLGYKGIATLYFKAKRNLSIVKKGSFRYK